MTVDFLFLFGDTFLFCWACDIPIDAVEQNYEMELCEFLLVGQNDAYDSKFNAFKFQLSLLLEMRDFASISYWKIHIEMHIIIIHSKNMRPLCARFCVSSDFVAFCFNSIYNIVSLAHIQRQLAEFMFREC